MSATSRPFSPITSAGGWLAVSGQVGVDPDTDSLASGVFDQTRQALANLSDLLTSVGATLGSVVKVNVFLDDMAGYDEMNRAYAEAFAGHRMPSRTAVAVAGLPLGAAVEIEAWALTPAEGAPSPG